MLGRVGIAERVEERPERGQIRIVDLEAGQHAAEVRAVVPVVEQADVPTTAERVEEVGQRAGTLGKLEPAQTLVADLRRVSADHVPDVQLGHLVVGEIDRLVAARVEQLGQRDAVLARLGGDADEDVRLRPPAQPVVELRDDAAADRRAEFPERAGTLGNRDRQQRLARLAHLRTLGDEAKPIEVHVGAAQHRHQRLAASPVPLDPRLQAGGGQRAGRLHHAPGVVEDVLDGGADLVVRHADDLVHRLAHDRKRDLADLAHGHAVREDADVIEPSHDSPPRASDTSHRLRTARRRSP